MSKTAREVMTGDAQCIDGHRLIGIVSQADVARGADEQEVGELVEAISQS